RAGHFAMEPYLGPDSEARLATLEEVAAEVGATPNQVVLAWLMAQTSPTVVPLIGPRTLEQYEENVAALDVKLTTEQLARLDAAGAQWTATGRAPPATGRLPGVVVPDHGT